MSYRVNALVTVCAAVLLGCGSLWLPRHRPVSRAAMVEAGAQRALQPFKIPFYFEPNLGQLPPKVRYAGRGLGYDVTLQNGEVDLTWTEPRPGAQHRGPVADLPSLEDASPAAATTLRMAFAGAHPGVRLRGTEEMQAKIRYAFAEEIPPVPTFERVRYEQLYHGIDLVYYERDGGLKYDFILAPGASPDSIRMRLSVDPAQELRSSLDRKQNLALHFGSRDVEFQKPTIFQEVGGRRQPIEGGFRTTAPDEVGFWVGHYDPTQPLIIDPTLVLSRLLGGADNNADNSATSIQVDTSGKIYVGGYLNQPEGRVHVAVLSADGSLLMGLNAGQDVNPAPRFALDTNGNIYIAGFITNRGAANDFKEINPTYPGACGIKGQGFYAGVLVKLDPSGKAVFGTCFPHLETRLERQRYSYAYNVAADNQGNAYVVGSVQSDTNDYEPWAAKINTNGGPPLYYFHAAQYGFATGVGVDPQGAMHVGGTIKVPAGSQNSFPVVNPLLPCVAGAGTRFMEADLNVFLMKINSGGNAVSYSSCIGRGSLSSLAVDALGAVYGSGTTDSSNFPVRSAFQSNFGGETDGFVFKINPDAKLAYSTYLGGLSTDGVGGIAVDKLGNAYVTGSTTSVSFATINPIQNDLKGGQDAFVGKLGPQGDQLLFATFLGGSKQDSGSGIALDGAGAVYVAGKTESADFPTRGVNTGSLVGRTAAFIAKIDLGSTTTTTLPAAAKIELSPLLLDFDATGSSDPASKQLRLKNSGGFPMNWEASATATSGGKWLAVQPGSGTLGPGDGIDLKVTVDPGNVELDLGDDNVTFDGKITVTAPVASNTPQSAAVSLKIPKPKNSIRITNLRLNDRTGFYPEIGEGSFKFTCDLEYLYAGEKETGTLYLQAFMRDSGVATPLGEPALINAIDSALLKRTEKNVTITFTVNREFPLRADIQIRALLTGGSTLVSDSRGFVVPDVRIERAEICGTPAHTVSGELDDDYLSQLDVRPFSARNYVSSHLRYPGCSAQAINWETHMFATSGRLTLFRRKFLDKTLISTDVVDQIPVTGSGARKGIFVLNRLWVDDDADRWVFDAQLETNLGNTVKSPSSDSFSFDFNIAEIDRIRIKTYSPGPAAKAILTVGDPVRFDYDVEYVGHPDYSRRLVGWVLYNGESRGSSSSRTTSLPFGDEVPFKGVRKLRIPEDPLFIPGNIRRIQVQFGIESHPARESGVISTALSDTKDYTRFRQPDFTFPAGLSKPVTGLGVGLNILENGINRTIGWARDAKALAGGLSELAHSNLESATQSKQRAAADPFKDFIGINSYWEFTPTIAGGGGNQAFSADLTFEYDPSDLPDDANFVEANLKIASFDPTTGTLTPLLTQLNVTGKTATARVADLKQYYTLGVFGPFSKRALVFPILRSKPDLYNGFGLVNAGSSPASVNLTGYGDDGALLAGTGVTNPASRVLNPGSQIALLAPQLFNFDSTARTGWVEVRADRTDVVGFELLGNDKQLDGVGVLQTPAAIQVLTSVESTAAYTTEIHLANPNPFPAGATLELHDSKGALLSHAEVSIQPKGRFSQTLLNLFSGLSQPFRGYVIVRGDHSLSTAELLVSNESLAALNGQPLLNGSRAATRLYSAQLASGGGTYYTRVTLVNPTALAAQISIRAVSESGGSLGTAKTISLGPGEQFQDEVGQLFGLNPGVLTVGSIIVESDVSGVIGDVSFGDATAADSFRSSLPLDAEPLKTAAFAQVANGGGYFTGLAVFNPNAQSVSYTVRVFRADGVLTGSSTGTVPAGGRVSKLLPEIVAVSAGQVGGYFTLEASQPVSSFALFGTETLSALSAIPALPVSNAAGPLQTTTTSTSSTTTTRPSTTTTSTTSTTRPSSTTTSTTTTTRPTTTTIATTTTSSQPTTTSTTRPSTTTSSSTSTTLPAGGCSLFAESFRDTSLSGWQRLNSTWTVSNGKVQIATITDPSDLGEIYHSLPNPNFFRLTMDVEADVLSGPYYGFEAYSVRDTFVLQTPEGTRELEGLGVVVLSSGAVAFFGEDFFGKYYTFNAANYGQVNSLGLQWASTGVTMIVNGTARQTLTPAQFGVSALPLLRFETLFLFVTNSTNASAPKSVVRFGNICQGAPQ